MIETAAVRFNEDEDHAIFPTPEIPAAYLHWTTNGTSDPASHLLTRICIAGVSMHLEAYAVHVEDGWQLTDDPEIQWHFDELYRAASAEGHWQTLELNGRAYVIFATPYC